MTIFPIIWLAVCVIAVVLLITFRPNRHIVWLVLIILLVAFAGWVSLPDNPGIVLDLNNDGELDINKPIAVRQGLDLAGGLQVLLEADLPNGQEPSSSSMNEVRRIVEDRINSLGALDPVVQLRGNRRLIIELPGFQDPDRATDLIRQTALLEFVELPGPLPNGTPVRTDYVRGQGATTEASATATVEATTSPEEGAPPPTETSGEETPAPEPTPEGPIYHTVMTGEMLQSADAALNPESVDRKYYVQFTLTEEGAKVFGDYTTNNVGGYLGIVLDGVLVSAPVINSPITGGSGIIEGQFTLTEVEQLATQLKYGALPVPLRVQSTNTVGPTLGQISVQQSIRAGIIGIAVVLLFMLVYYRLPGLSAALALLVFAVLNFAIYKFVPITLTLPAITGFLISVGTAVDGNILIFERIKEELRAGKRLGAAIDAGFSRAWTSIRDSNLSSLIICGILMTFGTSYGASVVTGFALTLAIGLVINLFTAVVVTQTFLHFILLPVSEEMVTSRRGLLGL